MKGVVGTALSSGSRLYKSSDQQAHSNSRTMTSANIVLEDIVSLHAIVYAWQFISGCACLARWLTGLEQWSVYL